MDFRLEMYFAPRYNVFLDIRCVASTVTEFHITVYMYRVSPLSVYAVTRFSLLSRVSLLVIYLLTVSSGSQVAFEPLKIICGIVGMHFL